MSIRKADNYIEDMFNINSEEIHMALNDHRVSTCNPKYYGCDEEYTLIRVAKSLEPTGKFVVDAKGVLTIGAIGSVVGYGAYKLFKYLKNKKEAKYVCLNESCSEQQ